MNYILFKTDNIVSYKLKKTMFNGNISKFLNTSKTKINDEFDFVQDRQYFVLQIEKDHV